MTKAVILVAIAFAALQLRNVARGWQEPSSQSGSAPAAVSPTVAAEADPEAAALVKAARERLSKWQSIQANVVQRVDIGDRKFKASGRFQAGEFPRTRLEYEVTVGNTVGKLLEVCDGQVLHIERRIEDVDGAAAAPEKLGDEETTKAKDASKPTLEAVRRDVQRILRATAATEGAVMSIHAADIGLGGLPALLASLDRTMVFDSLREEEHDGQTFRVVQGAWNPKYLAELTAKLGGLAPQLAMFLPDRVRIYFEADSLFPVRILYLKLASTEKRTYRAMLSLEFHDVEFDAVLPPETFSYRVPAGVQQKDDTDEFVQLLKASVGQGAPLLPPPSEEGKLDLRRSTDAPKTLK